MSLTINTNLGGLGSLNAAKGFSESQKSLSDSMKRLSSGIKINSAADDPAGLAASEHLRSQVSGISRAVASNERSLNALNAADSTLDAVAETLSKIKSDVIIAGNTSDQSTRNAISSNIGAYVQDIDQVANNATFAGKKLFDGSFNVTALTSADGQTDSLKLDKISSDTLGTDATTEDAEGNEQQAGQVKSISDLEEFVKKGGNVDEALAVIDKAISQVSEARDKAGAMAGSVQMQGFSLSNNYMELSSAHSKIRDADLASEVANVTRENIQSQVKVALMAQGKDQTMNLISLLR